ncbi:MAG TPA: hypothetical protein VK815_16705 [Candidatus Acidoferrales bacterium]|nr:hypothetical protein [Candidatus Acidoferrales bacterium]
MVTPDLINRHLSNGASPIGAPKISQEGQQMVLTFDGYCEVRIARGRELLTGERYEQMKTNMFVLILGSVNQDKNNDPSFPKIGSRALVQGLDTTIVTFTTSDGRFDVGITALMHTPEMVDSVAIAKDLSQRYDHH